MTKALGRWVMVCVAMVVLLPLGSALLPHAAAQPECVDSGSDALLVWATVGSLPAPWDCVRIDEGGRVTWLNLDALTFRDPGDGERDQDASFCFQSSFDGGRLGPGDRFSARFFLEDGTLVLRDVSNNGVLVEADRACPEVGVEIWHHDEAGNAVLPWIDYMHPGFPARRIVIDL